MLLDLPIEGLANKKELAKQKKVKKNGMHNSIQMKRNGFVICALFRAVNSAIMHYKQQMCSPDKMNTEKTLNFDKMTV